MPIQRSEVEYGRHASDCDCPACLINCRAMPGFMRPKDLEIMIPDGADPEVWAREHLCVSFGTIVRGEQFGFEPGSQVIIPTLVPKHIGEGEEWMACHWLKNGRCEIHPRKP